MNLEPLLFTGDANQAEARVYASLLRAGLPADARLAGELIGPHCRYSHTLPARIPFKDRGPGETLLAEAIVPDPCFWTPDLPFLYTAELRIEPPRHTPTRSVSEGHGASNRIEPCPFGIRRLGVRETSIYLDAKRFVPRGVRRESAELSDLKAARAAASALYVNSPSGAFLQEASHEGVLLAVSLSGHQPTLQNRVPLLAASSAAPVGGDQVPELHELTRLARWPAVAIVVLDAAVDSGVNLRRAARGALLAQRLNLNHQTSMQPWAHVAWCEIDEPARHAPFPTDMPVIIFRQSRQPTTIEEGRRDCDRLQADLSDGGDFAGYFT